MKKELLAEYISGPEKLKARLSGMSLENMRKYLSLFRLIRETAFEFIKNEPEEDFTKHGYFRTYKGERMKITMEKHFEVYNNHLKFHLDCIDELEKGFSE